MSQKETNEIIKKIRQKRKEIEKSHEAALAYLIKLGIVDENGRLTKNYERLFY